MLRPLDQRGPHQIVVGVHVVEQHARPADFQHAADSDFVAVILGNGFYNRVDHFDGHGGQFRRVEAVAGSVGKAVDAAEAAARRIRK